MKALIRTVLINAARFDYLEAPCDGHLQVIGTNGHGKTTLLRAILFFYVGRNDDASFAIPSTQDDFVTHYLGEYPSYLVYEVGRAEGEPPFHVAVCRPAGRVQFMFVDAPYDKSIYVDETRRVRKLEEVVNRLNELNVHHDVLHAYEDFSNTIYGVRKSPYAAFSAHARASRQVEILPRIVSGIFTVNRMDTDRLKRALACGLSDDPDALAIDLRVLRSDLADFQAHHAAVKTFIDNSAKAQQLDNLAAQYAEARDTLERHVRDFISRAKAVDAAEANAKAELARIDGELERLDNEQREADVRYKADGKILSDTRNDLRVNIAEAERYAMEYAEKHIADKEALLASLPTLVQRHDACKAQYAALTLRYEDENRRRTDLIAGFESGLRKAESALNESAAAVSARQNEDMEALHREEQMKGDLIDEGNRRKLSELSPLEQRLAAERNAHVETCRIFGKLAEPEPLAQKRRAVAELAAAALKRRERTRDIDADLKLCRERYEKEDLRLRHEEETQGGALEREKIALDARLCDAKAAVDKYARSVAAFMREKLPGSVDEASRALSGELLFSDAADFGASADSQAGRSILGMVVDTDALAKLPSATLDPDQLQARLDEVQRARQALALKEEEARKGWIARKSEADERYKAAMEKLRDEKQKLEELSARAQREAGELEARILSEDAEWKKQYAYRESELQKRDDDLKKRQRAIEESKNTLRQAYEGEKRQLRVQFDERRSMVKKEAQEKLAGFASQKAAQRAAFETDKSGIERRFLEELAAKGADPKAVAAAKADMEAAARTVAGVEATRPEVAMYVALKREKIDLLPDWRSQLDALDAQIRTLNAQYESMRATVAKQRGDFAQQRAAIAQTLHGIASDRKEADGFLGDVRFAEFSGLFTLSTLEPAADYQPDSLHALNLEAGRLLVEAEAIHRDGDALARRFLNLFEYPATGENVLGFQPVREDFNWIAFVGGVLAPFLRHNKIDRFRNVQSERFEAIVSQIGRQITRLDEAIQKVSSTARKVEETLRQDNFVDVLDSVELRVQEQDSDLLRQIRLLLPFQNTNLGTHGRDMFMADADAALVERAVVVFAGLVKLLETEQRTRLELDDCFEFAIRIVENGHDYGFRTSIDHIGSNGTDYLVKMLIYLALIDRFREQALDTGDKSMMHCILDETGVLATKYVREAMLYAERKNIILVTAGHSSASRGFKNCLRVEKRGNRFGGGVILSRIPQCS
jgi:hypothetical protein